MTISININGTPTDVPDNFWDLDEVTQHSIVDERAAAATSEAPQTEEKRTVGGVDLSGPSFIAGVSGAGAGAVLGPAIKSAVDKYGLPGLRPQIPDLPAVPPKFNTPTEVANQAIKNRASVSVEATPVENYGRSQFVNPEGKGLYYGAGDTGEYSGARKAAAEAIAAEKQFPGMKVVEGGSTPFALPENVHADVQAKIAAEKLAHDRAMQEEVRQAANTRAARLKAIEDAYAAKNIKPGFMEAPGQAVRSGIETGGKFLNHVISPYGRSTLGSYGFGALGGLDFGLQGTNAVEHALKGEYGRALASGIGAVGGALALTRHPLIMPLGMGVSIAAPYLEDYLDKKAKQYPDLHLAEGGTVPKKPNAGSIASSYQQVGPVQGPNLTTKFQDYAAALPEKTAQNTEHMNWMVQHSLPYSFDPKKPLFDSNSTYDPQAAKEFNEYIPNLMGAVKPSISAIKAQLSMAKPAETITFNVGRNIGSKINALANPEIESAIKANFPGSQVLTHDVVPANSGSHFGPHEPTSRVTISTPETSALKAQTHSLSEALNQDAIPAFNHVSGESVLAGPKAADWGDEFKKNYFVHPGETEAHGNQFAETVPFVHYSRTANLTKLDPTKYGNGMKGAEANRLADAPDIKPRSYFYVDRGEQTMAPESGVGGNKYQGTASGIYNLEKDPQGFFASTRANSIDPYLNNYSSNLHINNVERAIKDAGYNGYHTGKAGILFNETPVNSID